MTDKAHEEEENRLRERLKAKSQMRREQNSRASSSERDPDTRRSDRGPSPNNRFHHGDRRGSGGGRDRPHSYDDRNRHMPYRDGRRRRGEDIYGRAPPPLPPPPHDYPPPPPPRNHHRPHGPDPYYPPPDRMAGGRRGPRGGDRYAAGGGGGGRSPPSHRYRERPRSLSRSRSNSYDDDDEDDYSSRSGSRGRPRYRVRRSSRRSRSRSRSLTPSESESESESSRSSVESSVKENNAEESPIVYTKDQRTVFITQLVQRTVERDIKKYFAKNNLKVNEVILLRDKRTGRHKGCAYVELRRMEDVPKAVALSNVAPSFQRFPILIKSSEAEKNYVAGSASSALTASQMGQKIPSGPLLGPNGKLLEAQKVYVGSLDPSVTQGHLFVLFSQFGQLEKVSLQVDSASGLSKGFAFLSFRDPKEANLAIQTMGNQVLAGRPMKTGWAVNQIASIPGAEVVTSDEFPPDASVRATNAYKVLGQLTMGVPVSQIGQLVAVPATNPNHLAPNVAPASSRVPTVAEARATLAASGPIAIQAPEPAPAIVAPQGVMTDPTKVGNAENPTNHILVHNMFDKDQETEEGWENEIKEEFEEECSKFGKILKIKVMSTEPGGKIYASFDTIQGAQNCASSLAGRWFDKRRLQVEFVLGSAVPV
ncbi:hypothetical protein ACA910_018222 [Epithemia clementina (nom. ined.)]